MTISRKTARIRLGLSAVRKAGVAPVLSIQGKLFRLSPRAAATLPHGYRVSPLERDAAIRADRASGDKLRVIGARYGLSASRVHEIVKERV